MAGEEEADAPGVFEDNTANFKEFESDGLTLCLRQPGSIQRQPSDGFQVNIGQTGQEQAELVGPPLGTACSPGKEV